MDDWYENEPVTPSLVVPSIPSPHSVPRLPALRCGAGTYGGAIQSRRASPHRLTGVTTSPRTRYGAGTHGGVRRWVHPKCATRNRQAPPRFHHRVRPQQGHSDSGQRGATWCVPVDRTRPVSSPCCGIAAIFEGPDGPGTISLTPEHRQGLRHSEDPAKEKRPGECRGAFRFIRYAVVRPVSRGPCPPSRTVRRARCPCHPWPPTAAVRCCTRRMGIRQDCREPRGRSG